MAVRIYSAELDADTNTPLWPEQRSWKWLMGKKAKMPPVLYSAQYMNDPSGLRGVRYDVGWLQYYTEQTLPNRGNLVCIQTGDPATSERSTSNYFGHCTAGRDVDTGIIYILDVSYGHIPAPNHLEYLRSHFDSWRQRGYYIQTVWLEEVGPQQGTTQNLASQTRVDPKGAMPLDVLTPKGSKEQRYDSIMTFLKNGTVLFKGERQPTGDVVMSPDSGFPEFMREFSAFPRGGRDDVLDAVWMAVDKLSGNVLASGVTEESGEGGEKLDSDYEFEGARLRREREEAYEQGIVDSGVGSTPRDRVLSGGSIFHRGMR